MLDELVNQLIGGHISCAGDAPHLFDRDEGTLVQPLQQAQPVSRCASQMIGDQIAVLFPQQQDLSSRPSRLGANLRYPAQKE